MAQIYGPLRTHEGLANDLHLPTVAELDRDDRMKLAFAELDDRLTDLSLGLSSHDVRNAWQQSDQAFRAAIRALNLQVLENLVDDHTRTAAYELGRALSDTCWLPDERRGPNYFLGQFNRYRLAELKAWLGVASDGLPPQSASVGSQSLQNWQDWADANADPVRSNWSSYRGAVIDALRKQGHHWRDLLSGDVNAAGQPDIGAWLLAGESMLRTLRALVRKIMVRFWPVVVLILAAIGGVLYLSIANSQGTAKFWTTLVTIAGGFGVSGTSLRAAAKRVGTEIEQPAWQAAERDARAWQVTWLPVLPRRRLSRDRLVSHYRLWQRGVAPPAEHQRLEGSSQYPLAQPQPTSSGQPPAAGP